MGVLILIAAAVVLAGGAVGIYNALVRRRNLVAEGWSGIEVQLKRRADLIPNLVQSVKGYAAHEHNVFDELARLRAAAPLEDDAARRGEAEAAIGAGIDRLLAVAEAYPDLKASGNFQSLQNALAETEDQIQLARRYYNGAARNLNTMIEQFPSNLVAQLGRFKPAPYFQIENDTDRAVPQVAVAQ